MTDDIARPVGRDAVRRALIDATTQLAIEQGLSMSVRDIAARAGVNHGLVHTYFGSKDALISAAFDDINARAAAEASDDGFPPLDLASRRGGELVKALARLMLDADRDLFTSHPVVEGWRDALDSRSARSRPGRSGGTHRGRHGGRPRLGVVRRSGHHHARDGRRARASADARVTALFAEIGAVPPFT